MQRSQSSRPEYHYKISSAGSHWKCQNLYMSGILRCTPFEKTHSASWCSLLYLLNVFVSSSIYFVSIFPYVFISSLRLSYNAFSSYFSPHPTIFRSPFKPTQLCEFSSSFNPPNATCDAHTWVSDFPLEYGPPASWRDLNVKCLLQGLCVAV